VRSRPEPRRAWHATNAQDRAGPGTPRERLRERATADLGRAVRPRLSNALISPLLNAQCPFSSMNMAATSPFKNRLSSETSPYLLQHASNPVDWYPWGPEALTRAQREDKPILLSVGYSACHWCHVMERESFENPEVAQLMNKSFVCIKVDREERPDIDDVYVAVTIAISGSGGWPMTVFCTPEQVPFLAGTYFPPEDRYGRPGFRTLLNRIAELWDSDRDALFRQAG